MMYPIPPRHKEPEVLSVDIISAGFFATTENETTFFEFRTLKSLHVKYHKYKEIMEAWRAYVSTDI